MVNSLVKVILFCIVNSRAVSYIAHSSKHFVCVLVNRRIFAIVALFAVQRLVTVIQCALATIPCNSRATCAVLVIILSKFKACDNFLIFRCSGSICAIFELAKCAIASGFLLLHCTYRHIVQF